MATLEAIIERAVRETGLGWAGSISSLTTTTVVDSSAKATSLGTDAWKGAYLFRPDATSSVDYNRRISSFTVASGTFTHDGADYSDTTATSENYMVCPFYPAMDWVGVGFSWQRGVNQVLEKLPVGIVRDDYALLSGSGGRDRFSLSGLSGIGRASQIRRVWRRRLMSGQELSITVAEPLDNSETAVDVSDGDAVMVGDILRVGDEDMLVRGISTDTLTVVRGYMGSTAATHSSGAAIKRMHYLDLDARTQGMTYRTTQSVNSSGVYGTGLWFHPPLSDREQVVVEYLANWTALSTPSSTTEAPIEVLSVGAIAEVYKTLGPASMGEAALWQRRFNERVQQWMPGAVIREP